LVRLTRITYDLTAPLYPLSSWFFHRKAHLRLLDLAGVIDGQRVLEVAAGSGELFRRLVRRNPHGLTVGSDLSPGMMIMVRRSLNGRNGRNGNGARPSPRFMLHAADARAMPFSDGSFDTLVNCYLFELLPAADVVNTLKEFQRVVRPGGRMLLTHVGETSRGFNAVYHAVGSAVPCFWGRQVGREVTSHLEQQGFRILHQEIIKQAWYPTLLTVTERL
jgi:ubiquinone/menaquinone biosynthesis C-methylase UbiE